MHTETSIAKLSIFIVITMLTLFFRFGGQAFPMDDDPHLTGLPELTQEEITWQNEHMTRVVKVKLNKLGLQRINRWRKQKGFNEFTEDEANLALPGEEIDGVNGGSAILNTLDQSEGTESTPLELPPYVDNSSLKYFPPIRSQGSLPSCGCFSGTYYTMTYMYALACGIDAKNGGDDYRFSPKWTYNMINDGERNGSWYYSAYQIGQKHGGATWTEFPYDSDYRAWCLDTNVWRNALVRRFDQYGYVGDTHLDSGVELVKQLLNNGYILNIPTYINSWQYKYIGDDPSTLEDDPFAGSVCCYWVNGTEGYHAMTVVGYNDHIWVDINGDGIIDSGEKGAFRIANSWGTGWREGGFCWMAYDALKNPSAVEGGPSSSRIYGWYPSRAHWVTAKSAYEPMVVAEVTMSHPKRNQLGITLGLSSTTSDTPTTIWYPDMIFFQGGPYAFDGTTTECEATFVFDFTELSSSDGGLKRYHLGMRDSTLDDTAVLYSYKLIDLYNGGLETVCNDLPVTADAEQLYAYVDYDFDNGNVSPVAFASAEPLSGQAPLLVTLSAAGSYDPDGEIVKYEWNFPDGGSSSGMIVDYLFEIPGTYNVMLTVNDNMGGIDEDFVTIEVLQDPDKVIFVDGIDMALISVPGGFSVKAEVSVKNLRGIYLQDATVTGKWEGITNGIVSEVTGSDGIAAFISKKFRDTGIASFTVTDIIASGYVFDENLNVETSEWISTEQQINQKPTALISASSTAGVAPLCVDLDGSGSFDPDGQIVSYDWDFGNGETSSGKTVQYIYSTPGNYNVVLTVTDDHGETDSENIMITVTSEPLSVIFVRTISMSIVPVPGGNTASATVTVVDSEGNAVSNAIVTGQWSGLGSGMISGYTDSYGIVAFSSDKTKKEGSFVFTIVDISASGYIYDPSKNYETEDSIVNPS